MPESTPNQTRPQEDDLRAQVDALRDQADRIEGMLVEAIMAGFVVSAEVEL